MITLSDSNFTVIPEGRHIFKITEVEYKEDFGKMNITLVTADGSKQIERFSLINKDGEVNEKALNAFSYFARQALNNPGLSGEIDENDLVGCYIDAEVTHQVLPSNKDPQKTVTFLQLKDYKPASGFKTSAAASKKVVDIDDF